VSWIWCNGAFLEGPLAVSPVDRGLTHGLGVFETLLALDGRPLALDLHLERMRDGAERLGLEPAATLAVIEASSGQSWIGSDRMRRALVGDLAPRAHVSLLAKDTGLALQAATDVAFNPPLGTIACALFAQAIEQGWADLDDAVLLQLMRQR
jgi:hypothetical protein